MGGHPSLVVPCQVCSKPVDLAVDLHADENGQAVHEACYITRTRVTQWQESSFIR
jgi:hypothetical protein